MVMDGMATLWASDKAILLSLFSENSSKLVQIKDQLKYRSNQVNKLT